MYNEDATALPRDEEHFWEMVEDNLEYARHVIMDHPLETLDQALQKKRKGGFQVLSYRGTSVEMDQRDHYYEMGRELLPLVYDLVDRRELSFEFAQQWGKLMFCHGMLSVHLFDDSDALGAKRGAARSATTRNTDDHRRWLAHVFALPGLKGLKREAADHEVSLFLNKLRGDPKLRYPDGWFEKLLTEEGELRSAFTGKNFLNREKDKLLLEGTEDLPPLP